jgi:hypothetical protein
MTRPVKVQVRGREYACNSHQGGNDMLELHLGRFGKTVFVVGGRQRSSLIVTSLESSLKSYSYLPAKRQSNAM